MMYNPFVRALPRAKEIRKAFMLAMLLTFLLAVNLASAAAQSLTLDIDVQPLFDGIEQFFPIAMAVFGIIGGLLIAFSLARYLVNAFKNAFEGKSI